MNICSSNCLIENVPNNYVITYFIDVRPIAYHTSASSAKGSKATGDNRKLMVQKAK